MNDRAQKYFEYVEWVGRGSCTRLQAAEHFGVSKSTAAYHLERACSEGLLVSFHAYTDGNQTGYGYQASDQPMLLPFEQREATEMREGDNDPYLGHPEMHPDAAMAAFWDDFGG